MKFGRYYQHAFVIVLVRVSVLFVEACDIDLRTMKHVSKQTNNLLLVETFLVPSGLKITREP